MGGKLTEAKERTKALFVTPIDEAELAVRMIEAAGRMKRPPGAAALEALAGLDQEDRDRWQRQARAAMLYWKECIDAAQQPS